MGSIRREVWAGIGGAVVMAALTARLRPHRAAAAGPQPQSGASGGEDTANGASTPTAPGHTDYQWVVNVAAGAVTLAAGVLGVFGVTGGVAVALVRNDPAAVVTASLAAGVAVLLGVVSAFISPAMTKGEHPRETRLITISIASLAGAALALTGYAFTR